MGGNRFQFKRFTIEQDGCAMKVGTDGVLLGAWCRVEPTDKSMLDIGTGTGLIALQLAQRSSDSNATIEAVETDAAACDVASRNFDASEWRNRIVLHRMSAQKFAESSGNAGSAKDTCNATRFDHIVSNPPYFVSSLVSPDLLRNLARHTGSLSYEELMSVCSKLLKPDGRISLVLPAGAETDKMIAVAGESGFQASRRTDVHSTPKSGVKRCLLEFSRNTSSVVPVEHIIVEDAGPGSFSAEYRALTSDFYLYF